MSALPQLPPGLTPVQAGRFGLWLLGRRSHARAKKRRFHVSREPGYGLVSRFITLLLPWTIEEYPGHLRALSELFGVSPRTVEDWLYRPERLPAKQAERMQLICRERAAAFEQLATEFEALSVERPVGTLKRRSRGG